jgi:hypothetical protein
MQKIWLAWFCFFFYAAKNTITSIFIFIFLSLYSQSGFFHFQCIRVHSDSLETGVECTRSRQSKVPLLDGRDLNIKRYRVLL